MVSADGGEPRVLVDPDVGAALRPEWSPAGDRISYTFETPVRPAELFVIDVASGEKQLLHSELPAGGADELHMPEKVRYPSTDGLTIEAYLHRPPDAAPGERFPGVMWIHAAPRPSSTTSSAGTSRSTSSPSGGYVVLMPNIRGSSGYGLEFEDLNNECWGHCDLEDVLAGVDYLKGLPYVDPDKIAVTGTSYGGIMTMAAVAFAPDVFPGRDLALGLRRHDRLPHRSPRLQHIKLVEYELGRIRRIATSISTVPRYSRPTR